MANVTIERDQEMETGEQLVLAYTRLFKPDESTSAEDHYTLAQPSPLRYVQSITTDHTITEADPK